MPDKKYVYVRKTRRYNGKKYEATGKTEKEALGKLAEKIAAAKRGEDAAGGNMTVDEYFELWFKTYKAPKGLTEKSLSMYREKYERHMRPAIGSLRLREVTEVRLQAILNAQAGKSASHAAKLRMVMRAMFKRARQLRLIVYDPAELLELPTVTEGRRRPLTDDERASILETARRHPRGLWVLTLLYTGIRPGESAALRWGDIDLERREIRIRAARESGALTIKAPKTESGVRDIPIRADLLPLLETAKEAARRAFVSASDVSGPDAASARGNRGTRRPSGASGQAGTRRPSGASGSGTSSAADVSGPGTRPPSAASGNPDTPETSANGNGVSFSESYVFPGPHGKPADDNAIRRWWKSFLRDMDIGRGAEVYRNQITRSTLAPDLKLYCLRHTFATDLQRAGVALTVAKDLMGHSDISVTARYTHKDNALLHEAIARLDVMDGRGEVGPADADGDKA